MANETATCIFCGTTPTTREHVFPRWSHRHLGPRQNLRIKSFQGVQFYDHSVSRVFKMHGQMRDWQIKCVCGGTDRSCNSGWMNALEDKAQPILTHLILGHQKRISSQEQSIIAAWAALKAMVAENTQGGFVTTHHMQRKYLAKHSVAPKLGWGIWIGHYERHDWLPEWVSRPFLLLPDAVVKRKKSRVATYFNSNTSTQVIGKLFIQTIRSLMPDLIGRWRWSTPDGGVLFRIWPPSQFSIAWPSRALSDRDADYAAAAFGNFVLDTGKKAVAAAKAIAAPSGVA